MSVRLDMLRTVRRSLSLLGDSSALVRAFVNAHLDPRGGFHDRGGRADLYYTVFGIELLQALETAIPAETVSYLASVGQGHDLDFVHLSCLIRCRASAGLPWSDTEVDVLVSRIESHRGADGGYDTMPGMPASSAYGCFLAAAAYEDLSRHIPEKEQFLRCLARFRASDGGYGNLAAPTAGLTPTTAAVATLLGSLGEACPAGVDAWLLAMRHPESGFYAVPGAPIPDLLSTATALHALTAMRVPLDALREPCLDFVRSLWTGDGAFAGSWADPTPDCEYTYYGLLALGHLLA